MTSDVLRLGDVLALEHLGGGAYVGRNGRRRGAGNSVFGGQLVAQALRAAGSTVDADRLPHSVHSYFVRPARRDRPVTYTVEPIRDGTTVSIRHVRATQDDATTVLHALASFKAPEPGATLDALPVRTAPDPDACEVLAWDDLLDTRVVSAFAPTPRVRLCDAVWVRAASPLPDDPLTHACALAYLSDLGSGFATIEEPELPAGGPSLDHAVWFHLPIRADDWVLVDHRPMRASDARGTYRGTLRDATGRLGAVLCQELLLRMPSPYARTTGSG